MNLKKITISQLSELTGVNTVTLRAWERRYGLLIPQRSPKGHRYYSHDDVDTVIQILNLTEQGITVSKVKPLLNTDTNYDVTNDWKDYLDSIWKAAKSYNKNKIFQIYDEISREYPFSVSSVHFFIRITEKSQSMKDKSLYFCYLNNLLTDKINHSFYSIQQSKSPVKSVVILNNSPQLKNKVLLSGLILKEKNFHVEIFQGCEFKFINELVNELSVDYLIYVSNETPGESDIQSIEPNFVQLLFAGAKMKLNQEIISDSITNACVEGDPLDLLEHIIQE